MSSGSDILPILKMLGIDASHTHLSMGYHPALRLSEQGLRLKNEFSYNAKNFDSAIAP